ncbi:MAG: hypothetical protein K8953_02060 [Proteobacteria bacterium]|nr:hypothetical protein [Pseudomonadota bacterium]
MRDKTRAVSVAYFRRFGLGISLAQNKLTGNLQGILVFLGTSHPISPRVTPATQEFKSEFPALKITRNSTFQNREVVKPKQAK